MHVSLMLASWHILMYEGSYYRWLVEVPHENFIVQPSWLFCHQYQLTLKHMFLYMHYLFHFIFSLSRALYASFKVQIFHDKLVVRILEKGIMLCFVLFVPVVSLVTLRVICFLCIYVTNYLGDILRVMLWCIIASSLCLLLFLLSFTYGTILISYAIILTIL